ncbi:MAG: LamG domain-containing protein, partial [Candidatus Cloacimonetes bacterium]|nr:LamG domain-containing protein [Candidatus Cloacimonadota bacterium]
MKKFVILVFIFISITALMFAANNCVEFNASGPRDNSQRISVPTTGISASSGSVSLWFNYNSRSATERYRFFGHVQPRDEWKNRIFIGDDPAGGGEFEHDFYIGLGDTWDLDTNIFIPEIGTWYHAVLTWDNGDYVFYLDGGQESLGTYDSLITIADSADIGNSGKVDDQIYAPNAKIDNMRIYNRALTSTEVSDLYTSEISGPTNGLVAHWKFDTGSGTTAYDDTSNDNDGTLINGVSWATSLAPLPVTLSSFTAYYSENGPVLHWITQSEDDNIGWNIYRNDENELNNAVKVNTDLIDGQGTTA